MVVKDYTREVPRDQNHHCVRNTTDQTEEDEIPEMELSGGVRGKYYERYLKGTKVLLDPEENPCHPEPPMPRRS
ncbi:MAG TPA: hypothetical protein VLC46_23365 [Thermoanaerobaculia bacterium]|jgi:hypothetical protein|nr:hypothetical protein [Thermoanaerobaculia bacterium]